MDFSNFLKTLEKSENNEMLDNSELHADEVNSDSSEMNLSASLDIESTAKKSEIQTLAGSQKPHSKVKSKIKSKNDEIKHLKQIIKIQSKSYKRLQLKYEKLEKITQAYAVRQFKSAQIFNNQFTLNVQGLT